ncbi:MAG: tetratricopeptide repeat protein [Nitrospinota bacterium]
MSILIRVMSADELAAFDRAVRSRSAPDSPQVLNRLGVVACRNEFFDIAIGAYDRLLTIYQFDPKLFYNKSLVHVRQKEFGKALPLLARALTLDPEFAPAKVLHKKVRGWMGQMPAPGPAPEV